MDFRQNWNLTFSPPDLDRFPALRLGFEVAGRGGTSGAVLNAANDPFVPADAQTVDWNSTFGLPAIRVLSTCPDWS